MTNPEVYRITRQLSQHTNEQGTFVIWPLTTQGLENPNLDPTTIVIIEPTDTLPKLHHGNQTHTITEFSTNAIGNAVAKTHHPTLAIAMQTIPQQLRKELPYKEWLCNGGDQSPAFPNPNPPPNPNKNTK